MVLQSKIIELISVIHLPTLSLHPFVKLEIQDLEKRIQMVVGEDDNVYDSLPKPKKTKNKQTKQAFCKKKIKNIPHDMFCQSIYLQGLIIARITCNLYSLMKQLNMCPQVIIIT